MGSFFKRFGKGILYVIIFPFALLVLALYAVYGIGLFIVVSARFLFLFFTGRSLKDILPEDIEANKRIKSFTLEEETSAPEQEKNAEPLTVYPSGSSMYNSEYNVVKEEQKPKLSNPDEMTDISIDDGGNNDH